MSVCFGKTVMLCQSLFDFLLGKQTRSPQQILTTRCRLRRKIWVVRKYKEGNGLEVHLESEFRIGRGKHSLKKSFFYYSLISEYFDRIVKVVDFSVPSVLLQEDNWIILCISVSSPLSVFYLLPLYGV